MEKVLGTPVGRLAPSPTGALHLGNVRTFMIAWLHARAAGGRVVLRTEDLDHPKDKPGAAAQAVEDLRWLGFDWDEEHVQSERTAVYREALAFLRAQTVPSDDPARPFAPLVYPCVCSRRDVASAQSAPHAGEQLHYAGACRTRFASYEEAFRHLNPPSSAGAPPRLPCWRFRVPAGTRVAFDDGFAGRFDMDVAATLGDFPLARDSDGAGYTLAVVVDDLLMGVTEVVRGDDLLFATPAQLLIAKALAPWIERRLGRPMRPPVYIHVPLVVGPDGRRLAKRHGDTRVASFRQAGWSPERLIGLLAASCGWCAEGEAVSLADLLPRFTLATIPARPFVVSADRFSV